ncbi:MULTISPECIES: amino acid ABC transporter permease [unclassified Paraburkholderia]|uniref:amino acid ABC transporter permease n=1 Tax=unclassified Paraburkholderia TaxID=2615204 RepID=UPI00197CFC41|nr:MULTISPECIES: amino acid ABC transporter permease [unclassified Paraburkholderia]MBN3856970.1 amino acid ABC transporter permease [Paraburkholderia sp. Ac-20340]
MNTPDLLTRCLGYLPQLLDGAITTLWLSAVAVLCGFFAGIFIYMMSVNDSRLMSRAARVYVSVFRGTPVLAQLLVFYYVPSAFGLELPGVVAAAIGLSLNTAAYQSQILGAGFRSIPRGQIEAARTFNLTRQQTLWHIEVPQVVAMTLPALVSEMIDIVKASAVISVIAVTDLMRVGQQLASSSYRPLEVYTLAAAFYLAITSLLSLAAHGYERRLAKRG